MGTTLLAKKANQVAITTNDDSYEKLAADPTVTEFPQGSDYNMYSNMHNNVVSQTQSGGAMTYNKTQAGENAAQNAEILVKHSKESADWINKKWRPMMAIMYMIVCIFDFVLFPIMFTIVQFWETQAANDAFRQWEPLTLVGAGLFHMAMGAVLGITAYSRGQEKIAGVSNK